MGPAPAAGSPAGLLFPTMSSKMGEAMRVVMTAMITRMAKRPSEMIPRWRLILMMISSMRPRASMRMPMPIDSRPEIPVARAARVQAAPLPSTAATSIAPHMPQRNQELSRPILVLRPVQVTDKRGEVKKAIGEGEEEQADCRE
jgi:hypothetical protein